MFNRDLYNVVANPSDATAGTVTGAGHYGRNDVCRLQAIPNAGYIFLDWTDDNGTVVSLDPEFTFVVENDMELTANFLPEGDYCDLTFNLHDSYGDGWNGNYLVMDFGNGIVQSLTVPTGEEATFTLSVASGSHITLSWIKGSFVSDCSFTISYTGGDVFYESSGLGAGYEYAFDVNCGMEPVIQTVALSEGANWFSSNVEITLDDLKAALQAATPDGAITIQGQNNNVKYNPSNHRWSGRLTALDLSNMYKISVTADCEITLEGIPVDPTEHPATIEPGANWIAFPLSESMSPTNAFDGFAIAGDKIQSQSNNASYTNQGRWSGRLTLMEPGHGYIYQSAASATRTLIFTTGTKEILSMPTYKNKIP